METNAAGQNLAQAVEDGFYRRLLDQRGGHIEQGSIPAMGGHQASVVFRHGHQTSTEQLNRKPIANTPALDTCLLGRTLASRPLPTFLLQTASSGCETVNAPNFVTVFVREPIQQGFIPTRRTYARLLLTRHALPAFLDLARSVPPPRGRFTACFIISVLIYIYRAVGTPGQHSSRNRKSSRLRKLARKKRIFRVLSSPSASCETLSQREPWTVLLILIRPLANP